MAKTIIAAILVGVALTVSGCGLKKSDLDLLAQGPSQQFDPVALGKYANDQNAVLSAISQNAGFGNRQPNGAEEWKAFVVAGFEYADSQCEDYMEALRRLEIARKRSTQQLGLFGGATAGILGIVGAASSAIAITAVAFGLATATIDNLANSLLYELKPSEVRDLVRRTRLAYEQELKPDNWQDRPSAFRTIRGYVALCLPTVIEANVTAAIRVARPQGTTTSSGLRSSPPAIDMAPATSTVTIVRPGEPVRPTPPAPPAELAGDRLGSDENFLTRQQAIVIQRALCLPADGLTGNMDKATRDAIQSYRGFTRRADNGGLIVGEINFLLTAGACDGGRGYQNAYERFAFPSADKISELQRAMSTVLAGRGVSVPPTGVFDGSTRDAIKLLQQDKKITADGKLGREFFEK